MKVDGKTIAQDILAQLKKDTESTSKLVLTAVTCAPNFETQKYLEMKKRRAAAVGICLNVVELPNNVTTDQAIECVEAVAKQSAGVVVQLPLPEHIDIDAVLQAVPKAKDPDGFSYGEKHDQILPPVVGAIDEISKVHELEWKNKRVVILGQGRLVGIPAARYARKRGARVRVYEKDTLDVSSLKTADIIVSGIGHPKFIVPEMVTKGVVIFDAGTSEDGGELVGDMHKDTATVASLYTPVPGGIGPVTIAYLLSNLVKLARQNE
jgi:methylenetetrahydrofolate dehydrogenase (NADP+)/methenyltetrahydrofolate cyclohydrolase